MSRIPQSFIDELIARADIVEIVGLRVPLKKAGREFKACCPFHSEKTPSFWVSPEKQFYHCFGCSAHGTALGFLMAHDRLSFPGETEFRQPRPHRMFQFDLVVHPPEFIPKCVTQADVGEGHTLIPVAIAAFGLAFGLVDDEDDQVGFRSMSGD